MVTPPPQKKERMTKIKSAFIWKSTLHRTQPRFFELLNYLFPATKKDLENFKKKYHDASEKVADKYRQYQKLQVLNYMYFGNLYN